MSVKNVWWVKPTLIGAGIAWLVRGVMAFYGPDYWSPRTPLDYAAVIGASLALFLMAVGIWGFYLQNPAPASRAQTAWRVGLTVTCVAALTISVSNFIEDALGVSSLGTVWVIGILALLVGLLVAGFSALWVNDFSRWVGSLFLVCATGLVLMESGGMFGMGVALLVLSGLKATHAGDILLL
jgi:hypothetical protein